MYQVEKAKIKFSSQIYELVNYFAARGEMLPRPLSEVYENIRDFFVVLDGEKVIGCGALHISWADLAEIKSLAVSEDRHGKGIGSALVQACLDEARALGIPTVFCLTYKPDFFKTLGFLLVDKSELPHKVWGECYRCPKFPNCDEVALIYHMDRG